MTVLAALALVALSHWIVLLLYSSAYLPAVGALQALVPGAMALSTSRILANDIAGRGRPVLNAYRGGVTVATNVILNILWIPSHGIVGAAWASTVSYLVSYLGAIFFYCRLSGNRWTKVVLLERGDLRLYWRMAVALSNWARAKVSGA